MIRSPIRRPKRAHWFCWRRPTPRSTIARRPSVRRTKLTPPRKSSRPRARRPPWPWWHKGKPQRATIPTAAAESAEESDGEVEDAVDKTASQPQSRRYNSVLVEEAAPPVPGAAIIAEYIDETRGTVFEHNRLLPQDVGARVEVRRLMAGSTRNSREVSSPLVTERVYDASSGPTAAARPTPKRCVLRRPTSDTIWAISAG